MFKNKSEKSQGIELILLIFFFPSLAKEENLKKQTRQRPKARRKKHGLATGPKKEKKLQTPFPLNIVINNRRWNKETN